MGGSEGENVGVVAVNYKTPEEAAIEAAACRIVVQVLKSLRARLNRGQDWSTVLTRTIEQYEIGGGK